MGVGQAPKSRRSYRNGAPPSPPLAVLCQGRHLVASGKALTCTVSRSRSGLLPPGARSGLQGQHAECWRGQGRAGQGALGAVGAESLPQAQEPLRAAEAGSWP